MNNSHVHEVFQPILNNFFPTSAFSYPSYFAYPDRATFKGFISPDVVMTVAIGPYCSMVAIGAHNADDRNEAKDWEHISEEFFLKKKADALRRIEALNPAPVKETV